MIAFCEFASKYVIFFIVFGALLGFCGGAIIATRIKSQALGMLVGLTTAILLWFLGWSAFNKLLYAYCA